MVNPVTVPLGRAKLATKALDDGVGLSTEYNWNVACLPQRVATRDWSGIRSRRVVLDQCFCKIPDKYSIVGSPAVIKSQGCCPPGHQAHESRCNAADIRSVPTRVARQRGSIKHAIRRTRFGAVEP